MTKKNKRKLAIVLSMFIVGAIGCIFYYNKKIKSKHVIINKLTDLKTPTPYKNAILGIDVSKYQGEINWDKIAKGHLINFVYCRSTLGKLICLDKDESYNRNIEGLKKHPQLKKGSYHFLSPFINGKKQANFFIENSSFEKGDLIPVLDIERAHRISNIHLIKVVKDFISEFKQKTNLDIMIYSNLSFYRDNLYAKFPNNKLWVANYNKSDHKIKNTKWHVWQYTENGKIHGINSDIDVNILNGDSIDLNNLTIQ